jgi:hypothetical protein
MDTKTSPVSPIVSANHHLFFGNVCLFVLTLWLPHLFLPCTGRAVRSRGLQAAGSESRQAQNLPHGKPFRQKAIVSTDLSAMASPPWSWILQTWRVE